MIYTTLSFQKLVCYVNVIVVQASKWLANSFENLHHTSVGFSKALSHKGERLWSHIISSSPTQHGDLLMFEEYIVQISMNIGKLIEGEQCFKKNCISWKVTKTW